MEQDLFTILRKVKEHYPNHKYSPGERCYMNWDEEEGNLYFVQSIDDIDSRQILHLALIGGEDTTTIENDKEFLELNDIELLWLPSEKQFREMKEWPDSWFITKVGTVMELQEFTLKGPAPPPSQVERFNPNDLRGWFSAVVVKIADTVIDAWGKTLSR
jgi:hypothetical protein